jgi:hypothetical protein
MRKQQYSPPVFVGQNLYIKPSYIVSIPEFYYENKTTSHHFEANKSNLADNKTNGIMSPKAINAIKNAINWMLVSTRKKRVYSHKSQSSFNFKVAFITLTLPDTDVRVNNATFTKQLLNPFLVYLRKYNQLKNYVWKMEYQENGKLHCHITIDTFVHWRDIRKTWNRLLLRNGLLSKFERAYGHNNPNSTDIHSIKKVKNLAAYLAKYMAKNNECKITHEGKDYFYTPVMSGRIWSCNYELSRAKTCKVHIPADECREGLTPLFKKEIDFKKLFREHPVTKELSEIGEIFYPKAINWIKDITGPVKKTFDAMRNTIMSQARHFSNYELTL